MNIKKASRPLLISLLLGTIVGLVVVIFTHYNLLPNLERSTFDLRFNLRGDEEPAPEILIIGITEYCLAELGRWPWERDVHGKLFDILTEGGASVIGFDILISEPSRDAAMDEALIEATARSIPVIYPLEAPPEHSHIPGFFRPASLTLPLPELMEVARSGFINVVPEPDGIMRSAILWMEYEGWPIASFDVLIWAVHAGIHPDDLYNHLDEHFAPLRNSLPLGDFSYPLDHRGRTLINYSGGPGHFPVLPYHLVLEEAYAPSTFANKVILIGYYASGMGDYYFTPFSSQEPMYGIEVHANAVHTLLQAGPILKLPYLSNILLVFLLALGSMFIFQFLRPVWGFGSLILLIGLFYYLTLLLFNNRSLYVETVYPVMALGGSYLTALVYSFIVEQRGRQRVTRLFGRYVAPQVVEEILSIGEENLKLGGTRRRISILFIDIRGFTPLSEKLSPEGVVAVLNEYFDIVTRCIFVNKGTVDKFMGDAAMALFNAPLLLEDHALWAVRAAKAITEEGEALQKKVMEISGVTLHFGIGINTGDAVVGNIGAENRMEYTAIGDAVNLAARLESNAKPGQVLVSEAVYNDVAGRLPLEQVGEITVKGKSKPVMVYQLVKE